MIIETDDGSEVVFRGGKITVNALKIELNHLALYTGNFAVHTTANKLRDLGINVTLVGTQHVYMKTHYTVEQIVAMLDNFYEVNDFKVLPR